MKDPLHLKKKELLCKNFVMNGYVMKILKTGCDVSNDITPELVKDLKERCRKFIIKVCVGIRKRYSLNDPVMAAISELDPDKCIDTSNRPESLHQIFKILPRLAPKSLDEQQVIDEHWRKLPSLMNSIDSNQAPDIFWHEVMQKEGFSNLANFMLDILALPNSNAERERKFSELNDIKTKKKSISTKYNGNILAHQCILHSSTNCVNFQPNEKMLKGFTDQIYKNEHSPCDTDSD